MNPRQNYGERRWEFDIIAVDGEQVVVVEVKTTLRVPDVVLPPAASSAAGLQFAPRGLIPEE